MALRAWDAEVLGRLCAFISSFFFSAWRFSSAARLPDRGLASSSRSKILPIFLDDEEEKVLVCVMVLPPPFSERLTKLDSTVVVRAVRVPSLDWTSRSVLVTVLTAEPSAVCWLCRVLVLVVVLPRPSPGRARASCSRRSRSLSRWSLFLCRSSRSAARMSFRSS